MCVLHLTHHHIHTHNNDNIIIIGIGVGESGGVVAHREWRENNG